MLSTIALILKASGPSVVKSAAAEYCTFIDVAVLPLTVQLFVFKVPSLEPDILVPALGAITSKYTTLPLAFVALKVVYPVAPSLTFPGVDQLYEGVKLVSATVIFINCDIPSKLSLNTSVPSVK